MTLHNKNKRSSIKVILGYGLVAVIVGLSLFRINERTDTVVGIQDVDPVRNISKDSFVDSKSIQDDTDKIVQAFRQQSNNLQVQAKGQVIKILSDDNQGSRHQRFILSLSNNHTILIAHNIDLSPRISDLNIGDIVEFYGEYEYNPQGGVVHWTHHDPNAKHINGWLKHQNQRYQ